MRTTVHILTIFLVLFCACKNHGTDETRAALLPILQPADEDASSLINDKIAQTLKDIKELVASKDTYNNRILAARTKNTREVADDTFEYLTKWQHRLIDAAGGKTDNGNLKHGDDTHILTRIMVSNKGGDTLRWHLEEMREIMLKQVTDTASVIAALPVMVEQKPGTDWKQELFNKAPVFAGLTLLEKWKKDVFTSELIILNRALLEARKK